MSTQPVRPINDQVLIKHLEPEEKTVGGLYIPDAVQNRQKDIGVVIAVSESWYEHGTLITPSVKPGDKVILNQWAGTEVEDVGVLIAHGNIRAVIG